MNKTTKKISLMLTKKNILLMGMITLLALLPMHTQAQEILFPETTMTTGEIFREIENQTDYLISYPLNSINLNKKINLSSGKVSLKRVMEQVLESSNYTSNIRGHHILIIPTKPKEAPTQNVSLLPVTNTKKEESANQAEDDMRIDIEKMEKELIARKPEYPSNTLTEPVLDLPLYKTEQKTVRMATPTTTDLAKVAARTNLLYAFGTLTPNLGVEIGLNPHSTLLLHGSYNSWKLKGYDKDNKKIWHWTVGTEYRYWLCERFNGHFFGAHAIYGDYNISGKKIPLIFEKGSENHRYRGYGILGGVSYGYMFMLSKKWNLELNAGLGIGVLKYDKWEYGPCGEIIEKDLTRTFVGPTKLGITIAYIIK